MAASTTWRKVLNEHSVFKVLRQNKDDLKSSKECRGWIEVCDGELYLWNAYNSNILTTNLKCLGQNSQQDRVSYQTLLCTNPPVFDVEKLVFSETGTFLALVGQRGVSVVQLPQRNGKYAEYENGKKRINCKTIPIGERLFVSNSKVRLLHAAWHPGSWTDSHLVLLTSDNTLRIYNITNPQNPVETHPLSDPGTNYSLSASRTTFNMALGEAAVGFAFGKPISLESKTHPSDNKTTGTAWPLYILWGNGDVCSLLTSLDDSCTIKCPLTGPLTMYPPAEDNYGTDACSILCLDTTPPVLVISTCSGKLYHCVLLPSPEDECDTVSEVSWDVSHSTKAFATHSPVSLYVFESIELELSLTTVTVESDEVVEDDFSCPIRLHKDPMCVERFYCSHVAGTHSLVLPWIHRFQEYLKEEVAELPDANSQDSETIVEHLICTKPLPTSPASPVLGLTVTADKLLGPTLLTLTSSLECIILPLLTQPRLPPPQLLSTSPVKKVESPLKRLHKEPFDEHIHRILKKNASNPILRGASGSDLPPQELFQLLSRSTQVFREERIQKLDLARQEIERRVRVLTEQKDQQISDLQECEQMRNILRTNAEALAEKYEDISDKQQNLTDRLEKVLRKLQSRSGDLTVAERSMKRELSNMDIRLKQHKNSLEQLKMKQTYQNKQLLAQKQATAKTTGSPITLNKTQTESLRETLKLEGDMIADLVKQVGHLKLEIQA